MNWVKIFSVFLYFSLFISSESSCKPHEKGEIFSSDQDTIIIEDDSETKMPAILTANDIQIDKNLEYDNKYTIEDRYAYKDTFRTVQWDKIASCLAEVENFRNAKGVWAVVENYKNMHGMGPIPHKWHRNEYDNIEDEYGNERYQGIPLYERSDMERPRRYARDGWIGTVVDSAEDFYLMELVRQESVFAVPKKYVSFILSEDTDDLPFKHIVVVDRHQQNIVTLRREELGKWNVCSMQPCTTGRYKPPHARPTPLGIFLLQKKKEKMFYLKDGTNKVAGYAPFASRFSQGAYLHGVPTQHPEAKYSEYSWSLGTVPRSHMCVRLVSSHAQYIFDNFPLFKTLVIVIEE